MHISQLWGSSLRAAVQHNRTTAKVEILPETPVKRERCKLEDLADVTPPKPKRIPLVPLHQVSLIV